jgi:hypothetical protein
LDYATAVQISAFKGQSRCISGIIKVSTALSPGLISPFHTRASITAAPTMNRSIGAWTSGETQLGRWPSVIQDQSSARAVLLNDMMVTTTVDAVIFFNMVLSP